MIPIIGIVGTGIYLPKQTMSYELIAEATNGVWTKEAVKEKLGIEQVYIAGPEEGPQAMSVWAAEDCLARTGIDPTTIDLILSVTEEWKEYPLTTSSLYVQGQIGAVNAWGIDVQNRCSTTVSAMKIAKDMMQSDSDINTVMIVGGYRNNDFVDYTDKDMSMMYNLSSGAGAMILKKGYNKNVLLGTHIVSDGSLARSAGVEIGGTHEPITKDNIDQAYKSLKLMEPLRMKDRLNEVSMTNWFKCIDKALEKSTLTREHIDYLAILHIKRSGHEAMLKALNLQPNQTLYLSKFGHIGQIDQILSIHLAAEDGRLQQGYHVVMLAAGIGYVWAANVIRWG